jgi:hypothetical protein
MVDAEQRAAMPSSARQGRPCDDASVILDADAAQAQVFAVALMEQVRALSARLAKVERQIDQKPHHRSSDARREAAGLHRDIGEAQFLLQKLHRRFPLTEATG